MRNKPLYIMNHYGINNQQRKLEEEVFELQEAIILGQWIQPKEMAKEHIIEELADVQVLLDQIRYYYDIQWKDLNKIMLEKIERQIERIKSERSD